MGKVVKVLYVGAAPERVEQVFSALAREVAAERTRIFAAEGGTALVNIYGTTEDAQAVTECLVAEFGSDRVVDSSQVRPSEVKRF